MTSEGGSLTIGIDPSAKKIAVVGTVPVLGVQFAQKYPLYGKGQTKQDIASIAKALDAMDTFLTSIESLRTADTYAWVEEPLMGHGSLTSTVKQAYVGGIIRASLHRVGIRVYGVNVQTWKKVICGSGHAQKSDVSRAVRVQWPKIDALVSGDSDLTDAAAICLYATTVSRKATALRTPVSTRRSVQ